MEVTCHKYIRVKNFTNPPGSRLRAQESYVHVLPVHTSRTTLKEQKQKEAMEKIMYVQ